MTLNERAAAMKAKFERHFGAILLLFIVGMAFSDFIRLLWS